MLEFSDLPHALQTIALCGIWPLYLGQSKSAPWGKNTSARTPIFEHTEAALTEEAMEMDFETLLQKLLEVAEMGADDLFSGSDKSGAKVVQSASHS